MKNRLLLSAILIFTCAFADAQFVTVNVYSGPSSCKSFDFSARLAGAGWTSLSYNDSAWLACFNGAGAQSGSSSCAGPNQSGYGSIGMDTIIWSSPTTSAPDTACFRRKFTLPCGSIHSSVFSVGADDYYLAYINGHFLGTNPVDGNGVNYTLTSSQLGWFQSGENILAIEVVNSAPSCGELDFKATVTADTTAGCTTGINDLTQNSISIFPIPANNQINITADQSSTYAISMYDMIGNTVLSKSLSGKNMTLDISGIEKGIYILHLVDTHGNITVRKITKE